MNVTRDVVSDLWPLYVSGEASADTCRLVDEFLVSDPDYANLLEASRKVDLPAAAPPPDHEMKTLQRVKKHLRGDHWLFQLSCVFSALAFARIVSDTTFTAPPSRFIVTAIIAAIFWTAFFVRLYRSRRRFLLVKLR